MAQQGSAKNSPITPILSVFKEQLESECATLAKQHELTQRGHKLIWWYFLSLEKLTPSEVQDIFCDGGGDLGIDAVWIDDEQVVHFYQFKHPEDPSKSYPAGDVDRVISGLGLVIQREYEGVANPEVAARLDQVFDAIPKAYRLHLVTSGSEVEKEAVAKLNAFVRGMGMTPDFFKWECEHLSVLQARFYQGSLPSIGSPIVFSLADAPYAVKSGDAIAYFFHSSGSEIAGLFKRFSEKILQRNIRVDQGETSTNNAILATCVGNASANFLHFNNGISFLCDEAKWDNIKKELTLINPQIVNGGQTVRTIAKASAKGSLKGDVLVPARAIASSGKKTFANDVTVNQNNQNQMKTGFLRSNDEQVIQLASAMAAKGWFLERRKDELKHLNPDERKSIELRIKNSLSTHAIPLAKGSQAYVATFRNDPELAKKNVARVFDGKENKGYFEDVFDQRLTADKMITAYRILSYVEQFVQEFGKCKRKRQRVSEDQWRQDYSKHLGERLVSVHLKELDQAIPQSAMMLAALVFHDWVGTKKDPQLLPEELHKRGYEILRNELDKMFTYVQKHPAALDKSWPNILKSNGFYKKLTGDDTNGKATPKGSRAGSGGRVGSKPKAKQKEIFEDD